MPQQSHYRQHVFVCTNQREGDRVSCGHAGGQAAWEHLKSRVRSLGLHGPGQVQVSRSGCMNRCSQGPVIVVYPEAAWYAYRTEHDIEEIVDSHLRHGHHVQRLAL